MVMTDRQRATLYSQLTEAIGDEAAGILMEHLPSSGWGELASKKDIMASEERLHRRLGAGETLLQGELKAAKGELRVEIGASESRLGLRLDKILARIDTINHRFDKAKGRAS